MSFLPDDDLSYLPKYTYHLFNTEKNVFIYTKAHNVFIMVWRLEPYILYQTTYELVRRTPGLGSTHRVWRV